MKKFLLFCGIMAIAFSAIPANAGMTAEAIIKETWRRFRQVKTEKERIEVIIRHNDGREERKTLVRWTKFDPIGKDKIVIKFEEPARSRGLGLFIKRNSRKDQYWLKMPSWRRMRRISIRQEGKYFGGTDFNYEDTRQNNSERISDFSYRFLNGNKDYWQIEATPRPKVKSTYDKRVIWVYKKHYIIVQIDYYVNKLIKTQTNQKFTVDNNGRWRAKSVIMKNFLLGRTSTFKVIEREINPELENAIFSKRFLLKK